MTTEYPKIFKQGKSKYWTFKYTDAGNKRRMKSTGCTKKGDAMRYVREYIDSLSPYSTTNTLEALITLYTDIETNPRFRDKKATGQMYGERYAKHITRDAQLLLDTKAPILQKNLHQISRRDVKDTALLIVRKHGQRAKSKNIYKLLKIALSQAADDGLIKVSPAQGLADIKPEKVNPRFALPFEEIRQVLDENRFPDEYTRDVFIVLATTGLRRSEFLALIPSQIKEHTLCVNRAYKDDSCRIVGAPKWDKARTIYLPDVTLQALNRLFEHFPRITFTPHTLASRLKVTGALAKDISPEWEGLTPHVLRHSLNTALRLSPVPDILVREYMSWEHQTDIQDRYTHIYAKNLKPVADMIDKLCSGEVKEGREVELVSSNR